MQKLRGKAWYNYHMNDVSVYLGTHSLCCSHWAWEHELTWSCPVPPLTKMFDASQLTVDTSTCGFLWYTFSEAGVLPEAVAVVMIVIFMCIKDCKELSEGPCVPDKYLSNHPLPTLASK